MALSLDYTVQTYWTEALRDAVAGKSVVVADFEKYNLINRSQDNVSGLLYDLGSRSYIDTTTAVPSSTVKYGTTGSYVVATKLLTATLNANFLAGDEGNMIVLRSGTNGYLGTIDAINSTTIVRLIGDGLPTSDQASFDTITVLATTPTGSTVSLARLRMMRTGQQIALEVESTVTEEIEVMETIALRHFNTTAVQNRNKIAYALSGNSLYFKKGSSLSSYGTITIRYPRVPLRVTADVDYIDIPDGIAVQLGIMNLSTLIARRSNVEVNERTKQEILALTQSLNSMFGRQFNITQLKEKAVFLA